MGGVPRHSMAVFDKDVLATASYDRCAGTSFHEFLLPDRVKFSTFLAG
jgi:hypothetical protein